MGFSWTTMHTQRNQRQALHLVSTTWYTGKATQSATLRGNLPLVTNTSAGCSLHTTSGTQKSPQLPPSPLHRDLPQQKRAMVPTKALVDSIFIGLRSSFFFGNRSLGIRYCSVRRRKKTTNKYQSRSRTYIFSDERVIFSIFVWLIEIWRFVVLGYPSKSVRKNKVSQYIPPWNIQGR